MANGNTTKKKPKKKKSNVIPALITILVLTMVTGILLLIGYFTAGNRFSINNNLFQDGTEAGTGSTEATEEVRVVINMNDCSATVGTVINATATVYPAGGSVVNWISSDENVFVVDSDGKVVIVGTGIAALTASLGSVNDTVIIEGVQSVSDSVLMLPEYDENAVTAATVPASAETMPVITQTAAVSETISQNTETSAQTQQQTTEAAQTATESAATSKALSDIKSTDMAAFLTAFGFERHLDGTYVFDENEVCKGEVVLDSDKTHIYIIERSGAFDLAALSAIAKLIPQSYESVWKTAINASSDITMNADGRTIRVVVPENNGHKQIVIYN